MSFIDPIAGSEVARPQRMAPDLVLDPPPGPGNDYSWILDDCLGRQCPSEPVTVVVISEADDLSDLEQSLSALVRQTYPAALLDVVIVGLDEAKLRTVSAEIVEEFRSLRQTTHDRNGAIAEAPTDWIVVLDARVVPLPELVERFARRLDCTDHAVFCGQQQEGGRDGLRSAPYPFCGVDVANVAFSKRLFEDVGEFDDSLSPEAASVEWGYRVWNRGNYIVPVFESSGAKSAHPELDVGAHLERLGLNAKCPVSVRPEASQEPFEVPLVSIYIPVFNAVDTIVPAITSALGQTITDLEVCVVDDGSTDGTAEAITSAFGSHPRVRVVRQSNAGIGAASNRAVRMCRAPFIGQLDADDLLLPHAVERSLEVLGSDTHIGVTYSSSELIDSTGARVGDSFEFPYFSRYELMYLMIVHHFRLFRARDWYRTDGFATDISNAVDYDMYLKLSEVTELVHIPEQLYQYRKHSGSTSQALHRLQRANHRLVVQRSLDRRGLSPDWQLSPAEAKDPREYEFVRRVDGRPHFGRGIDSLRLSICADGDGAAEAAVLAEAFRWDSTIVQREGELRVESPLLSHVRGLQALGVIEEQLPRDSVRLNYKEI